MSLWIYALIGFLSGLSGALAVMAIWAWRER